MSKRKRVVTAIDTQGSEKKQALIQLQKNPFNEVLKSCFSFITAPALKRITLDLYRIDPNLRRGEDGTTNIRPNGHMPNFLTHYAGICSRHPRKESLITALIAYEANADPACSYAVWSKYIDHLKQRKHKIRTEACIHFGQKEKDIKSYLRHRHLRVLPLRYLKRAEWPAMTTLKALVKEVKNDDRAQKADKVTLKVESSLKKEELDEHFVNLSSKNKKSTGDSDSKRALTPPPLVITAVDTTSSLYPQGSIYKSLVRSLSSKIVVETKVVHKYYPPPSPSSSSSAASDGWIRSMLCDVVLAVDDEELCPIATSSHARVYAVPSHDYLIPVPTSLWTPAKKSEKQDFWFGTDQVLVLNTTKPERIHTIDGYTAETTTSQQTLHDTPYTLTFRCNTLHTKVAVRCFKHIVTLAISNVLPLPILSLIVEYNY